MGKTYFLEDKITHKQGENSAANNVASNTTLKLFPPPGYYNGEDVVTLNSEDFVSENILSGHTIFGKVGSIPVFNSNKDAISVAPSSTGGLKLVPPAGYYNGNIKVLASDANFVASNIKAGVSIFGLTGTLSSDGGGAYELLATGQAMSYFDSDDGELQFGRRAPVTMMEDGGKIWAWGWNEHGQLGVGDTVNRNVITQVNTKVWKKVIGLGEYAMAIDLNGHLWSWGRNSDNQLGFVGDTTNSPVLIDNTKTWKDAGYCFAIDADGHLWSWGRNDFGQLGVGDNANRTSPIQIGNKTWKCVAKSSEFSVGIDTDGHLWSWGRNNYGKLGFADATNRYIPMQVPTEVTWKSVSISTNHVVAIDSNNHLWTWGYGYLNALGHGDTSNKNVPTLLDDTKQWKMAVATDYSTMALTTTGELWACGNNNRGQLGLGHKNTTSTLTQVGDKSWWKTFVMHGDRSAALDNDDKLWMWGNSDTGIGLGDETDKTSPVKVSEKSWKNISLGAGAMYTLDNDGRSYSAERFNDNLNNTLTDTVTGLVWIKDPIILNESNQALLSAKGAWAESIEYVKGDVVQYPPAYPDWSYQGSYVVGDRVRYGMGYGSATTYKCIKDHSSSEGTTDPEYGSNWQEYWEAFTIPVPNAWRNGQSYTAGQMVSIFSYMDGTNRVYVCTTAHTSSYENSPGDGGYYSGSSSIYWASVNDKFVCIKDNSSTLGNNCFVTTLWKELPFCGSANNFTTVRTMDWVTAMFAVKRMNYMDKNWIIPNLRELSSLINFGKASPATDHSDIKTESHYWTSTVGVVEGEYGSSQCWCVHFTQGEASLQYSTAQCNVILLEKASE